LSDFYEDLVVGTTLDLGSHHFTRDEVVNFARRYDPQSFHLDEAAAARGPFGRLAASGWHTAAIWMKLYVAHRQATMAALIARGTRASRPGPSPGFRDLKWKRPVYVGDTISYRSELTGKRPAPTPGWGLIFHHNTGTNQDGLLVFEFFGTVFWERRIA
jgi:acyl dehydratase